MNRLSWKHACLACYIGVVILSIFNHEPWRDEAQAWLIVRDLPVNRLFAQANYEGTPMLWHLLLLPLVKLKAPYLAMHLLHACIAAGVVYLVLFKSPFSPVLKVLIVASYYISWEYAVIARNYSISVLLMCMVATLYHKKLQHPRLYAGLLFLLFNTNVHSMGLAAGLAITLGYELYKYERPPKAGAWPAQRVAIGTVIAGFVLAIIQLLPAADNLNRGIVYQVNWKRPAVAFANAFFPGISGDFYVTIVLALLLVAVLVFILMRDRGWQVLFISGMGIAGMAYVFAFKHPGSLRHHGLLLMVVLFVWWIYRPEQQLARIWQVALCLCLGLSVWMGASNHLKELGHPFSGAEEAASFLAGVLEPEDVVVAHPSIKASAMLPYLPTDRRFWYADVGAMGSFVTWHLRYEAGKAMDVTEAVQTGVLAVADKADEIFVVLDAPMPAGLLPAFEPVFRTREPVWGYGDEVYFIYRKRR